MLVGRCHVGLILVKQITGSCRSAALAGAVSAVIGTLHTILLGAFPVSSYSQGVSEGNTTGKVVSCLTPSGFATDCSPVLVILLRMLVQCCLLHVGVAVHVVMLLADSVCNAVQHIKGPEHIKGPLHDGIQLGDLQVQRNPNYSAGQHGGCLCFVLHGACHALWEVRHSFWRCMVPKV